MFREKLPSKESFSLSILLCLRGFDPPSSLRLVKTVVSARLPLLKVGNYPFSCHLNLGLCHCLIFLINLELSSKFNFFPHPPPIFALQLFLALPNDHYLSLPPLTFFPATTARFLPRTFLPTPFSQNGWFLFPSSTQGARFLFPKLSGKSP